MIERAELPVQRNNALKGLSAMTTQGSKPRLCQRPALRLARSNLVRSKLSRLQRERLFQRYRRSEYFHRS